MSGSPFRISRIRSFALSVPEKAVKIFPLFSQIGRNGTQAQNFFYLAQIALSSVQDVYAERGLICRCSRTSATICCVVNGLVRYSFAPERRPFNLSKALLCPERMMMTVSLHCGFIRKY